MRILILHDYLDNVGGGEKVVLTLARGLGADVATLDLNREVVEALSFGDVKIIDMGSTPKLPPLKQIVASLRFLLCDFRKDYDVFIFSGNWAHYAAGRHRPNLWYCHTPVRAFYTDYERLGAGMPWHKRLLFKAWVAVHRVFDRRSVGNVQRIVANSLNTQGRIRRYYGRESVIVWPSISLEKYRYVENGDFWLSVNRLYPEKRVDLQVEAFRRMPTEKLVIVGGVLEGDHSGGYVKKLKEDRPDNVEFIGRAGEKELLDLYGRCKGFICTAVDEDFGLTPLEAMASGKPVIAAREGGYLETVVDGETGVFIDAKADDLIRAVGVVGADPGKYRAACLRRAGKFSHDELIRRVRAEIQNLNAGF